MAVAAVASVTALNVSASEGSPVALHHAHAVRRGGHGHFRVAPGRLAPALGAQTCFVDGGCSLTPCVLFIQQHVGGEVAVSSTLTMRPSEWAPARGFHPDEIPARGCQGRLEAPRMLAVGTASRVRMPPR